MANRHRSWHKVWIDPPMGLDPSQNKSQISAARKVNRPMVTMVVAFILMVYIDGLAQDAGGTVAIRAITRCKYFANEIETKGQTWATDRKALQIRHENRSLLRPAVPPQRC